MKPYSNIDLPDVDPTVEQVLWSKMVSNGKRVTFDSVFPFSYWKVVFGSCLRSHFPAFHGIGNIVYPLLYVSTHLLLGGNIVGEDKLP